MTQIRNVNLLVPDIQEWLLFLPRIESGPDRIHLKDLQAVSSWSAGVAEVEARQPAANAAGGR